MDNGFTGIITLIKRCMVAGYKEEHTMEMTDER